MKYLITIANSRVKEYVSVNHLQQIIGALYFAGDISCVYGKWERHGKYKQLHYHGIFDIPRGVSYSKYTKLGGLHLHFDKINSIMEIPRIKKYIDKHYHKSIHTQLDTQLANYFAHHYCF